MRKQDLPLALLLVASLAAFAQDTSPKGAKEAFYDPQQPPAQGGTTDGARKKHESPPPAPGSPLYDSTTGRRIAHSSQAVEWTALGLGYWIELEDGSGSSRIVTDQQTFKSGDRIRLHFRANTYGRVQIMQLGASGRPAILFPDAAKEATDNLLQANEERILPTDTSWFKFDHNAGTETLFVTFARTQKELDHVSPPQPSADGHTPPPPGLAGGKDLLIETETKHAAERGTYAVSLAGKPMVLQIVLKHR